MHLAVFLRGVLGCSAAGDAGAGALLVLLAGAMAGAMRSEFFLTGLGEKPAKSQPRAKCQPSANKQQAEADRQTQTLWILDAWLVLVH